MELQLRLQTSPVTSMESIVSGLIVRPNDPESSVWTNAALFTEIPPHHDVYEASSSEQLLHQDSSFPLTVKRDSEAQRDCPRFSEDPELRLVCKF